MFLEYQGSAACPTTLSLLLDVERGCLLAPAGGKDGLDDDEAPQRRHTLQLQLIEVGNDEILHAVVRRKLF